MPNAALPLDALIFALLSAVAFACLDLAQKWSSRYAVATPRGFLALRLMAGAVFAPLLFLLPGAWKPNAPPFWMFVAMVVANFLGNLLYLWGLYKTDVSVVGSLWPLKNLYLPFLAFLLPPHERFRPLVYLLILLATFGALGVAWNKEAGIRAFRARPIWIMALVTVPVFALSDWLFGKISFAMSSGATATVYGAWALAALGCPILLSDAGTRDAVRDSLRTGRGALGAALTGTFLVLGIAAIGEAFRRAGGSVVLVNVFAMLSGVLLISVNALIPGWLETENRRIYAVRLIGTIILCTAATYVLIVSR